MIFDFHFYYQLTVDGRFVEYGRGSGKTTLVVNNSVKVCGTRFRVAVAIVVLFWVKTRTVFVCVCACVFVEKQCKVRVVG